MRWNAASELPMLDLDLDRDLPTTADDVRVLAELRADVPSWLTLDPAKLETLLGDAALVRRPVAQDDWPPFSLE
jgi:hypothetical protein